MHAHEAPTHAARAIRSVLTAADALHGAPGLPGLSLRLVRGGSDVGGYSYRGAVPLGIDVSLDSFSLELTGAHELGHYVDHQLLGSGRFASEHHAGLAAWRAA